LLPAAEGGKVTGGPETAPRTGLQPPALHETIVNPPLRGRREHNKQAHDTQHHFQP